jgi:glutathione S-transferase
MHMTVLQLYYHPFSSYCQKALVAFYEYGIDFEPRLLEGPESDASQMLSRLWPIKRFPVLVDGERVLPAASIIIEHLAHRVPAAQRLLPEDPAEALEVRLMDRFFDNYPSTPQQKVVFDALRSSDSRDPFGVQQAREQLDIAYGWLDQRLAQREWAAGERFSLADCGAAPFLFYADWTHAIGPSFPRVKAYRQKLLQRPSFKRAVDEARPYRKYFPLGAPDRD